MTVSQPERNRCPEVLPERLKEGAKKGDSRTAGRAREKLKFSASDVLERQHWNEYMGAYEEMIRNTSTERGALARRSGRPQVVHAVVVAEALVHVLDKLNLSFPKVDAEKRKDLKKARIILKNEK